MCCTSTVAGTHLPGQADHVVVEMNVMCVPKYNKHHSQFQRNKIKQTGFAQHLNNDIPDMHIRFVLIQCCGPGLGSGFVGSIPN
jgi:hypothetical protein